MTLSLHALCWIILSPVLPRLSMLFEAAAAAAARLRVWMCERGEGGGGGKRDGRSEGMRQESQRAANCVNKRWVGCFFFLPPIFSNNLTYCYTEAGGLIHRSAASQHLSSNYRGIFCYLWLSPIIRSEVLQLYAKAACAEERNPLLECNSCPKTGILTASWCHCATTNTFSSLVSRIHVTLPGASSLNSSLIVVLFRARRRGVLSEIPQQPRLSGELRDFDIVKVITKTSQSWT